EWREVLEAEEKVLARNNGMAAAKVWEGRLRRKRELERERLRADETVCRLLDEADAERETIKRLKERRREYEAAVNERIAHLEARDQTLAAAVEASEASLAARIRDLDDDTIDRVLEKVGTLERVEEN